jgi:hypothetical protein
MDMINGLVVVLDNTLSYTIKRVINGSILYRTEGKWPESQDEM